MERDDDFEQAAEWLEDVDDWTPARRAAFLAWVSERPGRWSAAQRVWSVIGDGALTVALGEVASVAAAAIPEEADIRRGRRWSAWGGAGAAVAASAAALWFVATPRPPVTVAYDSIAGAGRVARLADGSTLRLDPDSRIAVTLAADARRLDLTRGRGLFQVAHDATRPFAVRAGAVEAVALGTVFSVDRIGDAVEVRVEEGRVRASDGADAVTLMAGTGARFVAGRAPGRLHFTPDPRQEEDGRWLRADDDRLDGVVARFGRHHVAPMTVDPAVAALPVAGRFRLDDPEASLRLIAEANGLHVTTTADGLRIAR